MLRYLYDFKSLLNKYKVFSSKICSAIEAACTEKDEDRNDPDLGGCCSGLVEVAEPRLQSHPKYCSENDPNHGQTCWSHFTMCRNPGKMNEELLMFLHITIKIFW